MSRSCGGEGAVEDRYLAEHGIPSEHYAAAFALGIAEVTGGPVPRFEKVERPEEYQASEK